MLFLLLSTFSVQTSIAQNYCGTTSSGEQTTPNQNSTPCFDVNTIIAECTPVYLRVNFHLFVRDNCTGSFDINNYNSVPQEAAYFEANQPFQHGIPERVITEMNELVANNKAQMLPGCACATTIPCVPLRFVLGDVQVHCDETFRDQQSWNTYQNTYGQFTETGINVYYSKHPDPRVSGQGELDGEGVMITSPWAQLLLHEIGHNLSLNHTFGDDGCTDTPLEGVAWDRNCSGTNVGQFETNWPCWELIPPTDPWCLGTQCPLLPENKSPCCDPCNIYNNVMGYNHSQHSLTACQINRMLTRLANNYTCDYIAQIGGDCPPPAAVLDILPIEFSETDCRICLQGGASMNDDSYKLEYFDYTGQLVYSSGWRNEKVGKFCVGVRSGSAPHLFNLLPNHDYTAVLTVKSECGTEDSKILEFKTPNPKCEKHPGDEVEEFKINPNPSKDVFTISFQMLHSSPITVLASNLSQIEPNKILFQSENQLEGEVTLPLDASNWTVGLYDIQLISNNGIIHKTFTKQ
jgi:Pregnancy-associated plasma protein-A